MEAQAALDAAADINEAEDSSSGCSSEAEYPDLSNLWPNSAKMTTITLTAGIRNVPLRQQLRQMPITAEAYTAFEIHSDVEYFLHFNIPDIWMWKTVPEIDVSWNITLRCKHYCCSCNCYNKAPDVSVRSSKMAKHMLNDPDNDIKALVWENQKKCFAFFSEGSSQALQFHGVYDFLCIKIKKERTACEACNELCLCVSGNFERYICEYQSNRGQNPVIVDNYIRLSIE